MDRIVKMSTEDWMRYIPVAVVSGFAAYVAFRTFSCKKDTVNQSIQKDLDKVVNVVDIEDLGEKGVFCRCWRSKKVVIIIH